MYIKKGNIIKSFNGTNVPEGWQISNPDSFFSELKSKDIISVDENQKLKTRKIREIQKIKSWMKNSDYIELQAIRGTISRTSEKYIEYKKRYDESLQKLKNLELELELINS